MRARLMGLGLDVTCDGIVEHDIELVGNLFFKYDNIPDFSVTFAYDVTKIIPLSPPNSFTDFWQLYMDQYKYKANDTNRAIWIELYNDINKKVCTGYALDWEDDKEEQEVTFNCVSVMPDRLKFMEKETKDVSEKHYDIYEGDFNYVYIDNLLYKNFIVKWWDNITNKSLYGVNLTSSFTLSWNNSGYGYNGYHKIMMSIYECISDKYSIYRIRVTTRAYKNTSIKKLLEIMAKSLLVSAYIPNNSSEIELHPITRIDAVREIKGFIKSICMNEKTALSVMYSQVFGEVEVFENFIKKIEIFKYVSYEDYDCDGNIIILEKWDLCNSITVNDNMLEYINNSPLYTIWGYIGYDIPEGFLTPGYPVLMDGVVYLIIEIEYEKDNDMKSFEAVCINWSIFLAQYK